MIYDCRCFWHNRHWHKRPHNRPHCNRHILSNLQKQNCRAPLQQQNCRAVHRCSSRTAVHRCSSRTAVHRCSSRTLLHSFRNSHLFLTSSVPHPTTPSLIVSWHGQAVRPPRGPRTPSLCREHGHAKRPFDGPCQPIPCVVTCMVRLCNPPRAHWIFISLS